MSGDGTNTPGIRSEQAAAFGYGLLLPVADASIIEACRRMLEQHRDFSDRARVLWPDAPASEVGYTVDSAPTTSGEAVVFAIRLESDVCHGWTAQIAAPDQSAEQKALAVDALRAASIQFARWRTMVPGAPFSALPGLRD